MINSDWEGPWVTADHAFDIMSKGMDGGDRLFQAISGYDDYLAYTIKKKDYEPGDTLVLIAPFLIAFGLDDEFLISIAKDNSNFIAGSIKAIELLQHRYRLNIISTSYHQYVHYSTYLAGIPRENTYCTWFPVDEYASEISPEDKELVKKMADTIRSMTSSMEGAPDDALVERLDNFFWEVLPNTGFSKVLEEVRPVGGGRKLEALKKALKKDDISPEQSVTIGDSITDWKMLKYTRDSKGLAVSFNGNEYAVTNCNVAVMSKNCMVTALLADVFERRGLEIIEQLTADWGWAAVKKLVGQDRISNSVYNAFRQAFTAEDFPVVQWVTPENLENCMKISKAYRKSVRGTQIGSLG